MKAVRVLEYGGHLVRDILTPTIARDEVLVKIRCGRGRGRTCRESLKTQSHGKIVLRVA
jgi:hypothetical protein